MARYASGWIKLYRSAIDEDIGGNVNLLAIWVTLLCWASRSEITVNIKGEPRKFPAGSIVLGMQELADRLGISKPTIYRWINYLSVRDTIQVTSDTRGTVITIRNWKEYQENSEEGETPEKHEPNARLTRALHERTPNGEVRKKKGEGEAESASALPPLAVIWNENISPKLSKVLKVAPNGKRGKACQARWEENPDKDYWVRVIKKINQSPFCLGSNDRGWKADFDFLCTVDGPTKVLEGKYDAKLQSVPTFNPVSVENL